MDTEVVESSEAAETAEEIKDPAAVLAALEKAKKEAKTRREDNEALKLRIAELEGKGSSDKYKERALKSEIKDALKEKGIKNVDGVLKHISLKGIDFDEEDKLIGLEATLQNLKEDIPELFSAKARAGVVEQFSEGVNKKPMTASEKQAAMVLRKW